MIKSKLLVSILKSKIKIKLINKWMKNLKLSNKSKKVLSISILIKTKNNLTNFMKKKMRMK